MTVSLYDEEYFKKVRGAKGTGALFGKFLPLVRGSQEGPVAILDLGCGRGELLYLLAQDPTVEAFGLDFSSAAVEASRKLLEREDRVICGSSADSTLFEANSFDVICMMDVVEHLPPADLLQTLSNVNSWLKPGGRLVIHTFPTLGLHQGYRLFLKLLGKTDALKELDGIHCNVQTRKRLRQVVDKAGLECQEMWLENDFTLTSSTYQGLPAGVVKSALGFFLDQVLGSEILKKLLSALGLLELARPSIYCLATPSVPAD